MSSITQTIPNYQGGISQQPDELKLPGQVTEAKNVIPDLVDGLTKRPGGRLIKSLSDGTNNSVTNGRWFHYYRDENEQYIGQISRTGSIKMWSCIDGSEKTVHVAAKAWAANTAYVVGDRVSNDSGKVYVCDTAGTSAGSGGPSGTGANISDNSARWDYSSTLASAQSNITTYLTHSNDEDVQTLTLNDFTYITNRTKTVAMAATTAESRPFEAYIELKKVAYANQYALNLFNDNTTTTSRTATRIKVELVKSSNNYCHTGGNLRSRAERITDSTRCDSNAGDSRDAWAPNVATELFAVGSGTQLTDTGPSGSHTYTITVNDGSGTVTGRANLYFRIATIGQSVPYGDGSDVTYQARYTTTHDLMYGGEGWAKGDYFNVWMKDAYYKITIEEDSVSQIQGNLGIIRPTPTSFDTKTTVTAESILGDLETDIVATSEFTSAEVKIIGNGIYLTNGTAFNATSPTGDLLNVITSECNDIEDLPTQCKHGYVVKVKNSIANEDDYYVQFFGENGRDGPGTWEECPEPNRKIELASSTMPVQLVRQADGSFLIEDISWDQCGVGNTTTVPEPSFVGKTINKMIFFRNRMVMLSDENVIMSQPGDFYNFWPRSAITYTATDVIDLSCSSETPAIVYDGIQVNSGLVLFTKNQQFMLTTDSDVLSPQTAKINSLATYNFNVKTNPISMGTTIAFLDNAGKYSRFWEVAKVLREGEPIVIDQSKVVNKLFDKDLELISNSRENGIIFFSKKGSNTLFGYKYFNTSEKRIQQSWFTWELMGTIQHHAVLDDALYVVVRNSNKDVLQKFPLKYGESEHEVTDDMNTTSTEDDITYRIHLDNSTTVPSSDLAAYDATQDRTLFTLPTGFNNSSGQLAIYALPGNSDDYFQGYTQEVSTIVVDGVTKVNLPGNWKSYDPQSVSDGSTGDDVTPTYNLVLGYQFDMEVKLPTIYFGQQSGDSYRNVLQGSLVIHRIKLNFGANGMYTTILDRTGKPQYTETWEPPISDQYGANRIGINEQITRTIPTYEKNKNLTLTLKSTHPTPATLYSMSWEGDYTNQNYRSV